MNAGDGTNFFLVDGSETAEIATNTQTTEAYYFQVDGIPAVLVTGEVDCSRKIICIV